MPRSSRGLLLWAAALPLLVACYLYLSTGRARVQAGLSRVAAADGGAQGGACDFPGSGSTRRRLVVAIVDSLRDRTAFDERFMPWLSTHRARALSGRMEPCLSQLSLLCFRTMFEGSEPLLAGAGVDAPSLFERLAERGIAIAAVGDRAFISLYRPFLRRHAVFEEREPKTIERDRFAREQTFEFLADPSLDVIVSHVIDTDAVAHRYGVGHSRYEAKFRETDDFLRELYGRLGVHDSLIILGDHGHDERGYHSTGIPSTTAYFASGPLFPGGRRRDLQLPSFYFLAGAVTCEPTPPGYAGTHPLGDLDLDAGRRSMLERAALRTSAAPPRAKGSWQVDAAVLALGVALFGLLLRKQASRPRLALGLLGLALAAGFAGGLAAPVVLVTLQNHVNASWTAGFWAAFWLAALPLSLATRRLLGLQRWPALGTTAWAVVLFGLFLGPYYYGSLRNLAFATGALLLLHAVGKLRELGAWRPRSPLVVWTLLALVPILPLLAPVVVEWQLRWPLLGFADALGTAGSAAVALGCFAAGALLAPDRSALRLPALGALVVFALGALTETRPAILLAASLLQLSYLGFCRAALELGDGGLPRPTLLAIGQLSYVLILYFVLLGSLRFANVDFRFALALSPIEDGELAAALVALPLVLLKYFAPVVTLLLSGPGLRSEVLSLLFCKVLVLGAALLGMELTSSSSLRLFGALQVQELVLTLVLFGVLWLYLAASLAGERFRAGFRGPAVVEGAGAR